LRFPTIVWRGSAVIQRLLLVIAASRSEIIALVSAVVAISLAVWKTLENSEILKNCFPPSGKCLDAVAGSTIAFKIVFGLVFVCGIVLLVLNYLKLRESWRKAIIEPVGFFYDRVVDPGNPTEAIEHSLVQVRRTPSGGLEYRGVGRSARSTAFLDYRWRAREAWVNRANGNDPHKLFFRTQPRDIKFYLKRPRDDVFNVGVIEFAISNGVPGQLTGMFFDYTLDDDYLARGKIELSPASEAISKDAGKIFDRFFENPEREGYKQEVNKLIKKVEAFFTEHAA
jgi:hypothetical protein